METLNDQQMKKICAILKILLSLVLFSFERLISFSIIDL